MIYSKMNLKKRGEAMNNNESLADTIGMKKETGKHIIIKCFIEGVYYG